MSDQQLLQQYSQANDNLRNTYYKFRRTGGKYLSTPTPDRKYKYFETRDAWYEAGRHAEAIFNELHARGLNPPAPWRE